MVWFHSLWDIAVFISRTWLSATQGGIADTLNISEEEVDWLQRTGHDFSVSGPAKKCYNILNASILRRDLHLEPRWGLLCNRKVTLVRILHVLKSFGVNATPARIYFSENAAASMINCPFPVLAIT